MSVVTYEDRLDANRRWALLEGSMHFEQNSSVFKALEKVTRRLNEIEVDYAVAGGMALFQHGYRRFTDDVDILVNREGLKRLHDELEGHGWVAPFPGSKNLRDTENGVKVEFIITGDYPGDGKPKPVAFPEPSQVFVDLDGVKVLSLPSLIELKLASGITNPLRGKDLVDVQELISALKLDDDLAEKLNPFVRQKYLDIVQLLRDNPQPPE